MRSPVRALLTRIGAAGLAVMACAACGSSGGGAGEDEGALSVVASTNVYGDIATTIGGPAVRVQSIINDPNQDPHAYEADAKTRLALSKADLVIENGGGYDDFVDSMLSSSGNTAPLLNVVDISGKKSADLNEHVWYDLPTMTALVDRIVAELSQLDGDHAATFASNGESLKSELAGLESTAAMIAAANTGVEAAITEPVPLYLLEACGLENKTPAAFSEAVEEDSDVSARDLQAMLQIFDRKSVRLLVYSEQTSSPATEHVLDAAKKAGVATIAVRETLPRGEHYVAWMGGYLAQIQEALAA